MHRQKDDIRKGSMKIRDTQPFLEQQPPYFTNHFLFMGKTWIPCFSGSFQNLNTPIIKAGFLLWQLFIFCQKRPLAYWQPYNNNKFKRKTSKLRYYRSLRIIQWMEIKYILNKFIKFIICQKTENSRHIVKV